MSFEIYLQCFGESQHTGLSRDAVRSLFPVVEQSSKPDFWHIRYDEKNSCDIGVTPLPSNNATLDSLYVHRPCADPRLWQNLLSILRMGTVVMFWPGGPPIVSDASLAPALPGDMLASLGPARVVTSPEEMLRLLNET